MRTRLTLGIVAASIGMVLCFGSPAWSAMIADFQGDYLPAPANGMTRPAVSADGWDYMWNANAAIGTAAGNYSSLKWWSGQSHYNFDGAGGLPRANPAAYVSLHGTGGHPGRGVDDGVGTPFDRYAITAYTVQPTEGGLIEIANSAISVTSPNGNGVELRVYVNDGLKTRLVRPGGGVASSFDGLLGIVNPGDTVYVAMGPNLDDGSDAFNVAYQLDTVTDPSVVVWDADGTLPINGGAGGWDTASSRWYTGSGGGMYTTWNNAGNMNANFLATGGAVTLDVPISARSLTFSADGYTISGANALTLTNAGSGGPGPNTIDVTGEGATATISAPIAGNLTKIGSGTLTLTGATNSLNQINAAGGNLVLAGSSVTNASDLVRVGVGSNWVSGGGSGTLTIQDSAQLTTGKILMGENWPFIVGMTAVINQTGGTVTVTGSTGENAAIRIGHWGNETSTYNLSNGTLNITGADQDLAIGTDGAGIFYQTGGEAFAPGVMVNHRNAGGSAVFTVEGGTFNVGARGIQTAGGPATVNIGGAGGTIKASATFTSPLNMSINGGGNNGAFLDTNGNNIGLSGSLTGTGWLHKIGDGTLALTGGTHSFGRVNVSDGTLTLAGSPTVNISTGLHVAVNQYTPVGVPVDATLNIDSGSLTAQFIVMGDANGGNPLLGTINQTGGTVTTTGTTAENNGLRLGHYPQSNVAYHLSNGTLTIGDGRDLSAATDGTGWFNQTGGTLNVERIVVNKRAGSGGSGRVTLAGGTANVGAGGIITDSTPAKATLEYGGLGGTVRATASFSSPLDATLFGTGANAIRFDTNGNTITLSGALTGAGGLNKIGAGTLMLTGTTNSFTGPTVVSGGTLAVNNAMLYPGPPNWQDRSVTINNGAVLEVGGWSDGDTRGIGRVSFSNAGNIVIDDGTIRYTASTYAGRRDRPFTIAAGGATLDSAGSIPWVISAERNFPIVSSAGGLLTLAGASDGQVDKVIPGTGGVTKTGAGTWILTAANTYSGPTSVEEGTLLLTASGSVANTPLIDVATGATFDASAHAGGFALGAAQTLTGDGTVLADLNAAGTVSPGGAPGVLTILGDADLAASSTLQLEINGTAGPGEPGGHDMLDVFGEVDLAGRLALLFGYQPGEMDTYVLLNNDQADPIDGTFQLLPEGASFYVPGSSRPLAITYVGGTGNDVAITAVPEPVTLALAALALAGLGGYVRRRRA